MGPMNSIKPLLVDNRSCNLLAERVTSKKTLEAPDAVYERVPYHEKAPEMIRASARVSSVRKASGHG